MKKLILINGFPGAGKTTISESLLEKLDSAALIDTDDLMHVRPWQPNEELFKIALGNALLSAQNFFKHGYETVIVAGCVHSKELFDFVYHSFGDEYAMIYVQLLIDEDTRQQRAADRYEPLKVSLAMDDVLPAKFISIDTGKLSAGEAVLEIKRYC